MGLSFFKKKSREQLVVEKSEKVFFNLIIDSDTDFTNLEKVQVMNNVRRRLSEQLKEQKNDWIEQSIGSNQKAEEITSVLSKIE